MNDQYLPDGFTELKIDAVRLYSDGKKLVITGEPPESDEEAEIHNCDQMGCHWEHVLMTFDIDESNQKYISYVVSEAIRMTAPVALKEER